MRPLPLLAALLLSAAASTAAAASAASAPHLSGAKPPDQALRHLRDLRVLLDYDDDSATFAAWPVDKFGGKLPPDQIARGVRLGLALWASVLPDMRFRFVNRPEEANLAFRFGDYRQSGFGDGGGRAFLPSQWAELDGGCGRARENQWPEGPSCDEWSHNIITLHKGRWAVGAVDFIGNDSFHEYFTWVVNPRRPHFRLRGGPCRTDTSGADWEVGCVDFKRSPHYQAMEGVDLAVVVQHEFGHALVGGHTDSPGDYFDFRRRPILDPGRCVRLTPGGYSVMVPGDGTTSWWNSRGVSRFDAGRLVGMGYRVSYPGSVADLVLARPDGAVQIASNWQEADRALLWPLQGRPLSPRQARLRWFLVDVRLEDRKDAGTPAP